MNPPRRQQVQIVRDAEGRILCSCGCGRHPVRPRRNWFGQACVDAWLLRNNTQTIRRALLNRDHGVCALCGRDTVALRRAYWHDRTIPYAATRWEADHIVPVCLGGGQCGLEGYQTLCRPCHVRETALLAARRAKARRRQPEIAI